MSKKIIRIIELIEETISIYIPVVAFLFMFTAFCLQIFSRYILKTQYEWTYEFTVIGFMWTVSFGACAASKRRNHVSFSLLYDRLNEKGQAIFDIFGNGLILVAFLILIYPAFDFVRFMHIKVTPVLRVHISYVYAPMLFFIVMSCIYMVKDLLVALETLRTKGVEATKGAEV